MTLSSTDLIADPAALARALAAPWGSWGPSMTHDGRRVAFVSDRSGRPEAWVQDIVTDAPPPPAHRVPLVDDPVVAVSWSADDEWLACSVATDGGVRTQVWVVRPDGTGARRVAGSADTHARLGPWTRSGHRVVVTRPSHEPGGPTEAVLVDPRTGAEEPLAEGDLISVLDLSVGEELAVLRDGQRGHEFCVVVDRGADQHHPLLPHTATGSTEVAILRPAPPGEEGSLIAYLATEEGLPRQQLVAMPLGPRRWRGTPRYLAARDDAELEALDADDAGALLLLVWNVAGSSEVELFDTVNGRRIPVPGLPGLVASDPVLSRDGGHVVLAVEGPHRARELWHLNTVTLAWTRVTEAPAAAGLPLVTPELVRLGARDGTALSGWLYRPPGAVGAGPALVWLHGGPEAQERPTMQPLHQALAAAGITVFAPNIRGSSGFGREFVHADEGALRWAAFDDVLDCVDHLVVQGLADPGRVAVAGRSYGGYLALVMLAFFPEAFAAGVDICGMSDLRTFYRDTEPWIAAAAVRKYGDPDDDADLLRELSPLPRADGIRAPLLVVHGEHDTNVPRGEAEQIVQALRERGRDVEYLLLADEGHEYRRRSSRELLIETVLRFAIRHLDAGHGPEREPAEYPPPERG